jgi:hypothetical protein
VSHPIWVPLQAILIIHDRQIARHGGASGLPRVKEASSAIHAKPSKRGGIPKLFQKLKLGFDNAKGSCGPITTPLLSSSDRRWLSSLA